MVKKQKSITVKDKTTEVQTGKDEKKNVSLSERSTFRQNVAYSHTIFTQKNYILLAIALGIILLGFVLMSIDKDTYGFLSLSIAPVIVLVGFGFVFYAILYKDKTNEKGEKE